MQPRNLSIIFLSILCGTSYGIDFDRQIRPILADKCYKCHGPDQKQRQADLRLDLRDSLFEERDGYFVVKPSSLEQSELYRRIVSTDDDQMPPADSAATLSQRERTLIRQWIEEGAPWTVHWSFEPPTKSALPQVRATSWPTNAIDRFILNRLDELNLKPSTAAKNQTLLRRASFDLTGLPLVAHGLNSAVVSSEEDYEKFIEKLLASPRFGERFASAWLDAARYADTSGYQNDGERHMWRWRDWVINAINNNMPFDQFTVQQIAGDMLPNADLDQVIATGFNRNHRGNSEGGIVPEEYAVEYVVDRVETTATVWLGLTIGCARCHDHKFDPISQTEFYGLFDYFNQVPESGRAIKEGNSPPFITAPTPLQQRELLRLECELQKVDSQFDELTDDIEQAFSQWSAKFVGTDEETIIVSDGLVANFRFDNDLINSISQMPGKSNGSNTVFGEGKMAQSFSFDGTEFIDAGNTANFGYKDEFTLTSWIKPMENVSGESGGVVVSKMIDEPQATGYHVSVIDGQIHVNLIRRWLDDAIRVQTERALPLDQWSHVSVTYDGSRVAKGIRVFVDGAEWKTKINLDFINQSFATTEPLRIGRGGGDGSHFSGQIDELRVYDRVLTNDEITICAVPNSISAINQKPQTEQTKFEQNKLRMAFLSKFAPVRIRDAHFQRQNAKRWLEKFRKSLPTVMVMQEGPKRTTHFLNRGQYNAPGDVVSAHIPNCLPPLSASLPNNRLGLARWIVEERNPLTARVTVNRIWQMLFGQGIVSTAEDFGSQGERPSHPDLLDWLAVEFMESGWDVKHIVRMIVTSATYRQSSRVRPDLLEVDPDNRLLARGPRFRLNAEMIRDQALAASGLLDSRIGGPSVKPYQPAGLWKEIASDTVYDRAIGADLYRRSLYTFWKRTVAAPMMANFDASMRETCVVRKPRTNTPLQALTLMNDVTFVECARVLAERCFSESDASDEQIRFAFRSVLSREPSDHEIEILLNALNHHLAYYRQHPTESTQIISAGEFAVSNDWPADRWAALTVICSLILNLDEAVTKE